MGKGTTEDPPSAAASERLQQEGRGSNGSGRDRDQPLQPSEALSLARASAHRESGRLGNERKAMAAVLLCSIR